MFGSRPGPLIVLNEVESTRWSSPHNFQVALETSLHPCRHGSDAPWLILKRGGLKDRQRATKAQQLGTDTVQGRTRDFDRISWRVTLDAA